MPWLITRHQQCLQIGAIAWIAHSRPSKRCDVPGCDYFETLVVFVVTEFAVGHDISSTSIRLTADRSIAAARSIALDDWCARVVLRFFYRSKTDALLPSDSRNKHWQCLHAISRSGNLPSLRLDLWSETRFSPSQYGHSTYAKLSVMGTAGSIERVLSAIKIADR